MSTYGLSPEKQEGHFAPSPINYRPPFPKSYRPKIGVIGAGGIAGSHLANYRTLGLDIAAICDINPAAATARRDEFFPQARVTVNYRDILDDPTIAVVDITLHPKDRVLIVREAIEAGKHVLSQKPFVLDLAEGRELVKLAERANVRLAVNQNGRWAPHFSYLRQAVAGGVIGDVISVDFAACWDHTWIKGKPAFENIHHVVLYDFAIHWFDILTCFLAGRRAESVFAQVAAFPGQAYTPPSQASVCVSYPGALARMGFNAHTLFGEEDSTTIIGSKGLLRARGPSLNEQSRVDIFTAEGVASAELEGDWFTNGFQGSMGELLCAIEENREPYHSAANNLASLELCFAALASADSGQPVIL